MRNLKLSDLAQEVNLHSREALQEEVRCFIFTEHASRNVISSCEPEKARFLYLAGIYPVHAGFFVLSFFLH